MISNLIPCKTCKLGIAISLLLLRNHESWYFPSSQCQPVHREQKKKFHSLLLNIQRTSFKTRSGMWLLPARERWKRSSFDHPEVEWPATHAQKQCLVQAQEGSVKGYKCPCRQTLFMLAHLSSYQLNALVKTIVDTIIPNVWTDVVFLYNMPNENCRSMLQALILWVGLDTKPTRRE